MSVFAVLRPELQREPERVWVEPVHNPCPLLPQAPPFPHTLVLGAFKSSSHLCGNIRGNVGPLCRVRVFVIFPAALTFLWISAFFLFRLVPWPWPWGDLTRDRPTPTRSGVPAPPLSTQGISTWLPVTNGGGRTKASLPLSIRGDAGVGGRHT